MSSGPAGYSCHSNLDPHYSSQRVLSFSCALRWTPERSLRAIKYKYSTTVTWPSHSEWVYFGTVGHSCHNNLSCALRRTPERTLRAINIQVSPQLPLDLLIPRGFLLAPSDILAIIISALTICVNVLGRSLVRCAGRQSELCI